MIGREILHYKILEKLGQGGMGIVYKAEDTKLGRTVALKFLPAHVSASDEQRTRFITEAKAAALLSHPNMVPLQKGAPGGPTPEISRILLSNRYHLRTRRQGVST